MEIRNAQNILKGRNSRQNKTNDIRTSVPARGIRGRALELQVEKQPPAADKEAPWQQQCEMEPTRECGVIGIFAVERTE